MKKVKVLHIFPYGIFVSKYISGFCQYINDKYEHCFYIYGDADQQNDRKIRMPNVDNIIYTNLKCEGMEKCIDKSDIIVLGAIPEIYDIIRKINYSVHPQKQKLILIPFGRDLFRTSDIYRIKDKKLVEAIDEQKELLIENSCLVVTGEVGKKYIHDFFQIDVKTVWFDCLNSLEPYEGGEVTQVQDRCNIMLGHRGTWTGGHIEVLYSLKKYESKISTIICPLSYGNREYIDEIVKVGKDLYGEKFVYIDKWIPKNEYYTFLNKNVDIAIFNYNTSEGFNTLLYLIETGKKVYVNPMNDSYHDLVRMGFPIFEWKQEDIDFSEVKKPLDENQLIEVKKAIINMNENFGFKKWFEIFENIQ